MQLGKLFSRRAEADFRGTRWVLERTGFSRMVVTITREGGVAPLAAFRAQWAGTGTVVLASGESYRWKHLNFFQSRWAFQQADGANAIEFLQSGPIFRKKMATFVYMPGNEDTGALILLGFYLRLLRRKRLAALSLTRAFTPG